MDYDKLANELIDVIINQIEESKTQMSCHSGDLINSFEFTFEEGTITISGYKYGLFLDSGSKPHMPPVDSLRAWANCNGINPWAVAYSIKKNGTKPHPFLDKSVEKFTPIVNEYMNTFLYGEINTIYKDLRKSFEQK